MISNAPSIRLLSQLVLGLMLLGGLASPAQAQKLVEVEDSFPRLEVGSCIFCGKKCTQKTRTVCLPEGCEIDTSRSHSTDTGRSGFGEGGPGYGIFVSNINTPKGGSATHQLDAARRCLKSTVEVCSKNKQRGWYEARHVLYGRCGTPEPPQCKCPEGHHYNAKRKSCVTKACERVSGMPNGDKGGGYFAWKGSLFVDTPGADCPEPFSVTATPTAAVDCGRDNETSTEVELQISGGVGPYTCQASDGSPPIEAIGSTCLFKDLPLGTQTFTVVDAKRNPAQVEALIEDTFTLQAGPVSPTSCCGCADGSASVIANGDSGPFTYSWKPAAGYDSTATGLSAGTYSVTVADQRECFRKIDVTVPRPIDCLTSESPIGTTASDIAIWRLGQLEIGRVYPTTVTAENINCKGKHDFEVSIEDAPWFQITGPTVLRKIRAGKSLTTEATVDLRDAKPGDYSGRLVVSCLTCPPKCQQSQSVFEVLVTAE